jgi:anti-anti-sigma regulatory factor
MSVDEPIKIRIKDVVSSDLALRNSADSFFNSIDARKTKNITIDFSGVYSISRSFAQEYLKRKLASRKNLVDVNVPDNVRKMFEAVKSHEERKSFLNRSSMKFAYL